MCELCAPNSDGTERYFDDIDARCHDCGDVGVRLAVVIVVVVLLIVAMLVAALVLEGEGSQGASSGFAKFLIDARRIWRMARMRHKTKVGIGFYQCLAAVPGVFNLTTPVGLEHYAKWLDVLEVPVDIDEMVVPGSCLGNYQSRLWFGSMWPIVLVAFFAVFFVGNEFRLQRSRGAVDEEGAQGVGAVILAGLQRCLPLALTVSFVVVPSASTRLFQTFRCDSFEYDAAGEVREYLHNDYALNCQSDEYDATRGTAIFLLIIWPVGVPLLYAALLWASRAALLKGMRTTLSDATHFLSGDYKSTVFWWEPVEMCRKLLLTGWLLLVDSTAEQTRVVVAILLTVFFLNIRLAVKPLAKCVARRMAHGRNSPPRGWSALLSHHDAPSALALSPPAADLHSHRPARTLPAAATTRRCP